MNSDSSPLLLSEESLRSSLYNTLAASGITDQIKSQVRTKLIHTLKQRNVALISPSSLNNTANEQESRLFYKVTDSLIIDYMRSRGMDFSLSVYMPECGMELKQSFSSSEVERVLNLHKRIGIAAHILHSTRNSEHPFLLSLLKSLSEVSNPVQVELGCQTDFTPTEVESLESKMVQMERDHKAQLERERETMKEKFDDMKRQYEQRMDERVHLEVEKRMERFRETELIGLQVQEREKSQRQLEKLKKELEKDYLTRKQEFDDILTKEKRRIEEKEEFVNSLKQSLARERDTLKITETSLKRGHELAMQSLKMEEDNLKRKLEDARNEIERFKKREKEWDSRLTNEITKHKLEFDAEHADLISNLRIQQAKIEADRQNMKSQTLTYETAIAKYETVQAELESTKSQIRQKDQEIERLRRDIERIRTEKISSTTESLENEIHILKNQLIESQKSHEKRHEEYQAVIGKLMAPTTDLQDELRKARKSAAKWQRECQGLIIRLDVENARNDELNRRYDEEVVNNKALQREIADLRLLLHQSQMALAQMEPSSTRFRSTWAGISGSGDVHPTIGLSQSGNRAFDYPILSSNYLQHSHPERIRPWQQHTIPTMEEWDMPKSREVTIDKAFEGSDPEMTQEELESGVVYSTSPSRESVYSDISNSERKLLRKKKDQSSTSKEKDLKQSTQRRSSSKELFPLDLSPAEKKVLVRKNSHTDESQHTAPKKVRSLENVLDLSSNEKKMLHKTHSRDKLHHGLTSPLSESQKGQLSRLKLDQINHSRESLSGLTSDISQAERKLLSKKHTHPDIPQLPTDQTVYSDIDPQEMRKIVDDKSKKVVVAAKDEQISPIVDFPSHAGIATLLSASRHSSHDLFTQEKRVAFSTTDVTVTVNTPLEVYDSSMMSHEGDNKRVAFSTGDVQISNGLEEDRNKRSPDEKKVGIITIDEHIVDDDVGYELLGGREITGKVNHDVGSAVRSDHQNQVTKKISEGDNRIESAVNIKRTVISEFDIAAREREEEERRLDERIQLDRLRREKERMEREEKLKMEREQETKLKQLQEEEKRKLAEEHKRVEEERRNREREEVLKKQREKDMEMEKLENDPVLKRYMDMVKQQRKETGSANQQAGTSTRPLLPFPAAGLNEDRVESVKDTSVSLDFGAGDTDLSAASQYNESSDGW
ncbi:hypothetical protein BKA69DRAFT_8220 [Paraphysoderma sedebokerense]|nr:hypothetical protein BKA69DRAFT_8220 [Paraphysoderma sedebokerense]